MISPRPLLVASLSIISLLGANPVVDAAAPKTASAWGFELGTTPEKAVATLATAYPNCTPERSVYHESPRFPAHVTSGYAINPGLAHDDLASPGLCQDGPGGAGTTDSVDLRFAHPEVDAREPLYFMELTRLFPDAVYADDKRITHTFESLRAALFRRYGKPSDQHRAEVASSSANLATSLGIGRKVRREDYVVRYLWSAKGRLPPEEHQNATCDCGGPYVKAEIEISRSPETLPRNRYYVLSVRLLVEDPLIRGRQDGWNAQWLTHGSEVRK